MSLPKSHNTKDNEQNKFIDDSKGCVAVNTVTEFADGAFSDLTGGTPEIFNVDMTIASTEYSLALPEGTNRIQLKIRGNESKFTISYVSAGNVYTIRKGNTYEEQGLDLDSITNIYFIAEKGNLVMEIITWK
jgi:hypothetical protein